MEHSTDMNSSEMAEIKTYAINSADSDECEGSMDDTAEMLADSQTEQKQPTKVDYRPRKLLNKPSSLSTGKKLVIGLFIVCAIAFSWVGSTQTAKSSFNTGDFKAPFFVMWFGTAWMIVVFPITAVVYFVTLQGPFNMQGWKSLLR